MFDGVGRLLRGFWQDRRGNYALMFAIAVVPIMGGVTLAVDYSELSRHRQATQNALDAAGIATARRIAEGADATEARTYARDFFDANLGPVKPANAKLETTLPSENPGGTLVLKAELVYHPYFYPAFQALLGGDSDGATKINFAASAEIRLQSTLEVALVLDNSGSMDFTGKNTSQKRIDLLKAAAKELVTTLSKQAALMKQVAKPVQFGLVPFAASVNVGPGNKDAAWMDTNGISPIHHENFDWSSWATTGDRRVEQVGDAWYKKGGGWGAQENTAMTRFSLFEDIKRVSGYHYETVTVLEEVCGWSWSLLRYVCQLVPKTKQEKVWDYTPLTAWAGCVEMRPYPYNLSDAAPVSSDPKSLFVPMFAPDETDRTDNSGKPANNNWWHDVSTSGSDAVRQAYMQKYYEPFDTQATGAGEGPNAGCTTKPITPLTDVTTEAGLAAINGAIDAMTPLGATNVPQGLAWGWRVVSGGAPFTEGRGDQEKGNDKVVIVLTDGANTYYTPGSVVTNDYSGANWQYGGNDLAQSHSLYSAYGYALTKDGKTRILDGVGSGVSTSGYSNQNYSKAMNDHMLQLCGNAKTTGKVTVITVALDLDPTKEADKAQIATLTDCASYSKFNKNEDGTPKKLFYNASGADLAKKFMEIADELSNLRIVG